MARNGCCSGHGSRRAALTFRSRGYGLAVSLGLLAVSWCRFLRAEPLNVWIEVFRAPESLQCPDASVIVTAAAALFPQKQLMLAADRGQASLSVDVTIHRTFEGHEGLVVVRGAHSGQRRIVDSDEECARDAEVGQVPEALLQFGGVLGHDLGEGQALPGAEVDLAELRDRLGRQLPAPADDPGAGDGAGEVRGVDPGQGRGRELGRQVLELPDALGREADIVVAVVAVGVAFGHPAVAHQVEPGGGQGTLGTLGLETHHAAILTADGRR